MSGTRRLRVLSTQIACGCQSQAEPRSRASLTPDHLRRFREDGFVVVHGLLEPSELQPAKDAITRWVSAIAERLVAKGLLTSDYADLPFDRRLAAMEQEVPGLAARMHADKSHLKWPEMRALWSDPRFLDLCEQVLDGPEVAFHPNLNIRFKVPSSGSAGVDYHTVPWHQDAGYMNPEADGTLQVSVWLPLTDANVTNGCMQYVRGGHRAHSGVMRHRFANNGTWYLKMEEDDWTKYLADKEVVTLEIPQGSFILFNNWVPHRSLQNTTADTVRWSLDIRWQDPRLPAGMGPNGKLMHLRSAASDFHPQWTPVVGGAWNHDEGGQVAPRWPGQGQMEELREVYNKTRGVMSEAARTVAKQS